MNKHCTLSPVLLVTLIVYSLPAHAITADEINRATFTPVVNETAPVSPAPAAAPAAAAGAVPAAVITAPAKLAAKNPDPRVIKAQVLLDRRRLSPGVIDGYDGSNVRKARRMKRERAQVFPGGRQFPYRPGLFLALQEAAACINTRPQPGKLKRTSCTDSGTTSHS